METDPGLVGDEFVALDFAVAEVNDAVGVVRDVVERHAEPAFGEQFAGSLEQALAVAFSVSPQWLGAAGHAATLTRKRIAYIRLRVTVEVSG